MSTLILRTEDINDLFISPDLETIYFEEFSADTSYSFAIIYLNDDIDNLEISHPNGFQAYSYYLGNGVSYAVNSPFSLPVKNPIRFTTPNEICINESFPIEIENTTFKNEMEYEWDFGNGYIERGYSTDYSYPNAGDYNLKVTGYLNDCETFSYTDSISVYGTDTPNFVITGASQIFLYDTISYDVPLLETSTLNWEIIGGEIISKQDNQVTIFWNNGGENLGTVRATEITEEGCIGSQNILDVEIVSFSSKKDECLAYSSIFPNPVNEILSLETYT